MDDRGAPNRRHRVARRSAAEPLVRSGAAAAAVALVVVLAGCAPAAPGITAHTYTSTAGHDSTGELDWVASTPLVLSFDDGNGQLRLGLKTPCNALGAPATVTDHEISIDRDQLAATLMGCLGPEGGYEAWATAFIQNPMTYVVTGDTLILETDDAQVTFAQAR